ncbi:hypothetical protein U1Q18_010626, partial [Sarracenia purpurea var. burkii]
NFANGSLRGGPAQPRRLESDSDLVANRDPVDSGDTSIDFREIRPGGTLEAFSVHLKAREKKLICVGKIGGAALVHRLKNGAATVRGEEEGSGGNQGPSPATSVDRRNTGRDCSRESHKRRSDSD